MVAELSFSDEYHGRFRFYGPPLPLPGKCAVCGNAREAVVDFGATIDGWGALLFCWKCVIEATGQLVRNGVVEVPQPASAEDFERVLKEKVDEFDARMGSLSDLLDASRSSLADLASEVASRNAETPSGELGSGSEETSGTDSDTSDDAGDKRSPRVSGRNADAGAVAGL